MDLVGVVVGGGFLPPAKEAMLLRAAAASLVLRNTSIKSGLFVFLFSNSLTMTS